MFCTRAHGYRKQRVTSLSQFSYKTGGNTTFHLWEGFILCKWACIRHVYETAWEHHHLQSFEFSKYYWCYIFIYLSIFFSLYIYISIYIYWPYLFLLLFAVECRIQAEECWRSIQPPLVHRLQILFLIHTSRNEITIRTSTGAKLLAGTMNH